MPIIGKNGCLLLVKATLTTGQAIRHMRHVANMTGDQLAKEAEVSPAHLSRVENGKCRPSDRWVAAVLAVLSTAIAQKAEEERLAALGVPA